MTVEMWIKDTKTPTENDTSVLLENNRNNNILVQLSLNAGTNPANVREVKVFTDFSND